MWPKTLVVTPSTATGNFDARTDMLKGADFFMKVYVTKITNF